MADVESMFARLHEIPRSDEDYTYTASAATAEFGVDAALLERMRHAGLSRSGRDGPAYAHCDLHYLGLRLGLAHDHLWAVRLWRRSVERFVRDAETRISVTYLPQLPDDADPVWGRVVLPEEDAAVVQLRHQRPAGELMVTQRAAWPEVPDDVVPVLDEVATLDFCLLPRRLCGDVALARRIRMVECWTAAQLVVEGCRGIGRGARIAQGLMLGLPFSSGHSWAEVDVDGTWTPVDPLMVSLMRRYGGLDPGEWPNHRSLGPVLARVVVCPSPDPLVSREGDLVPTTFLTRVVS